MNIPQTPQSNPEGAINIAAGPKSSAERVSRKMRTTIGMLLDRGHVVTFSNEGVEGHTPLYKSLEPGQYRAGERADISIGVTRDLTGRWVKPEADASVASLNEIPTFQTTRNKANFYEMAAEHVAGFMVVGPDQIHDLDAIVSSIEGDNIVFKPINGSASRNVFVGDKKDAYNKLVEDFDLSAEGWIIQQHIADTELPKIEGISASEHSHLEMPARHRELRVFTFADGEGGYIFVPIGRVFRPGPEKEIDEFVYIKPESMPDEARAMVTNVADLITKTADVPYFFGAIDLTYGSVDGQEKQWYCMEANTKEPIATNSGGIMDDQRREDAKSTLQAVSHNLANTLERLNGIESAVKPTVTLNKVSV